MSGTRWRICGEKGCGDGWPGRADRVVEGDRLVEVTAGDVTVDLAAPASGVLVERCVRTDERLTVGQVLARIRPEL
jgi:pyruvate/2-oxoglutarate dehydrogenase complex dihydrolipoamide acyltransferase (E2) component